MKTIWNNIAAFAVVALMSLIGLSANAQSISITLKNGEVYRYELADLDGVRYVGGQFGSANGIGVKIYVKNSTQSIDFLYSQMESFEVVDIEAPVITPGSRNISKSTTVTITCGTPGAIIYYTTDGSDPTTESRSGTSPVTFTVNETKTVKAMAIGNDLTSEIVTAVYTFVEDDNINRNQLSDYWNTNTGSMTGTPKSYGFWRLEFPRISDSSGMSWVQKENDEGYGVNYALEWDNNKIANRWTCYQLNPLNRVSNVERKDDFKEDPELPELTRSTLDDYDKSGYSRGHLCPSADRRATTAMSKQTCFLSNIQPQIQYHNGGQWSQLEGDVRTWAANCDTLYIVKAATISDKVTLNNQQVDGLFNTLCNNRLIVPKYFYMALMAYDKDNDKYEAVGIWTYHCSSASDKQNAEYITIDELEKRTGIDFFCNLRDDIEDNVESKLNINYWIDGSTVKRR